MAEFPLLWRQVREDLGMEAETRGKFLGAGVIIVGWCLPMIQGMPKFVPILGTLIGVGLIVFPYIPKPKDRKLFVGALFALGIAVIIGFKFGPDVYRWFFPPTIEEVRAQIDSPSPLIGYGVLPGRFAYAQFDSTEIFRPWADNYNLLGIAQINFSNVDRKTNKGIGKSVPYTIDGSGVTVTAEIGQDQFDLVVPGQSARTEVAVYLIPKSVDLAKIVSLQSAEDLGGIYVAARVSVGGPRNTPIQKPLLKNPAPRHLETANKRQFIATIPKDRAVTVSSIGEAEAKDFAREILNFLRTNGFEKVEDIGVLKSAAPPRGVVVNFNFEAWEKPIEIFIGVNDNDVSR